MTAIAGFKCVDGVVIAGDTEETYGNDKVYAHKLFPADRKNSRLCVAGAGLAYLIDYANAQIVSALDSGITNVKDFESALADTMEGLYETKFKHYPLDPGQSLQIQLLVGAQFANEGDQSKWGKPALFECQSNLVTQIKRTKQSCILGAGEVLKQSIVQLASWGLTAALAEWASIYLIHEAKRRLGGAGGKTHVFVMKNDGKFSYNLGKNIDEKESILGLFSRSSELLMLSLDPSVTDAKANDFLRAGVQWLRDARRELKRLERSDQTGKHRSITIHDREIEKMIKALNAVMQSTAQKSEEGK